MSRDQLPEPPDSFVEHLDRVAWAVEVLDPAGVLFRPDPTHVLEEQGDIWVADETDDSATQAAADHGLTFEWCNDDDSVGGTRYYRWTFMVPSSAHATRTADGIPRAVAAVRDAIAAVLPAGLDDWRCFVDEDTSWQMMLGDFVRHEYSSLLEPIEAAFRPHVSGEDDDSQELVRISRQWGGLVDGTAFVRATVELGDVVSFHTTPAGLIPMGPARRGSLEIGARVPDGVLLHPRWQTVAQWGFHSGSVLVPVPRLHEPLYVVRTSGYGRRNGRPDEWLGTDQAQVAAAVVAEHESYWFPSWRRRRPASG